MAAVGICKMFFVVLKYLNIFVAITAPENVRLYKDANLSLINEKLAEILTLKYIRPAIL